MKNVKHLSKKEISDFKKAGTNWIEQQRNVVDENTMSINHLNALINNYKLSISLMKIQSGVIKKEVSRYITKYGFGVKKIK